MKMLSPVFPPRRPASLLRYAAAAVFLLSLVYYLGRDTYGFPAYLDDGTSVPRRRPHHIDKLIRAADTTHANLLKKQSRTLEDAAAAYRKQRGRHPPPGFDEWYRFAAEREAVLVEDFFDQIYHDLEPFWGLEPAVMRREAAAWEMTINVRAGNASSTSDWFWTKMWLDLVKTIEHLLPDMDIALNAMDEPRLVVPWEDIQEYMKKAHKTRKVVKTKNVVQEFGQLPPPKEVEAGLTVRPKDMEKTKPYWAIARRGCGPKTQARKAEMQPYFNQTPTISMDLARPHLAKGYVSNFTLSKDVCHQPDLQGLQGIFIEPLSTAATKVLFPMFGGSKLSVNNEILLPAAMYWNEDERFTGGEDHGGPWEEKKDSVVWRGVATGGRNRESNWRAFQRHRFVGMNNGSLIARAEATGQPPVNFALPAREYGIAAQKMAGRTGVGLGQWVESWADVAFTDLMCEPRMPNGQCNYTGEYFAIAKQVKMAEQFGHKYLPDIDGNSYSGRYLGFLKSTSLPLKATLWREWHDSRLVAWKHFVPMDNRFADWYGIMEYFLGYGGLVAGHDNEARRIALEGQAWADRVLRKEDMQIYVLRLLLEYARISDDRRENMGWVGDLVRR